MVPAPPPDLTAHRRDLRSRALTVLALGGLAAWQALDPVAFLLLYAWQWLLTLLVTLPIALGVVELLRATPHPVRAAFALVCAALIVWGMFIAMPLGLTWLVREPGAGATLAALWRAGFAPLLLPAGVLFALAGFAGWQARGDAAAGWTTLRRILGERATCHLAFLVLGPLLYGALLAAGAALGLPSPRAISLPLAFALCECWPFLRAWREAPAAAPHDASLAGRLARLRAKRRE